MDALAVNRAQGENVPIAYALVDCKIGEEETKNTEWKAKSATPILYATPNKNDHSALHRTLKAWAETYRDGILGKKKIIAECAPLMPVASTKEDGFVGRMRWALSDLSGETAQFFAQTNPAPPFEWLAVFSENRFKHSDLARFGITPNAEKNENLSFSLIDRPAPYLRAAKMSFLKQEMRFDWDASMLYLAQWLLRHLNNPQLILQLANSGARLHEQFLMLIQGEIEKITLLEKEGKTDELDKIRINSPDAIPSPEMRVLWNFLITNCVKKSGLFGYFYALVKRLEDEELSTSLRIELRHALAPKVTFSKAFLWGNEAISEAHHKIRCDLEFATDHVDLADLKKALGQQKLAALFEDFQQLLLDALGLWSELSYGEKNNRFDYLLPSISPHAQNKGLNDQTSFIELLRYSWFAVREESPERATEIAQNWFLLPHDTFQRLALFAASFDNCIDSKKWVDWLLQDNARWLLADFKRREVMRLLTLQGKNLAAAPQKKLEKAILAGPKREMYRDGFSDDDWSSIAKNWIWLRLAKLEASGLILNTKAAAKLAALKAENPTWQFSKYEKEEFSSWMTGTGEADYEESRIIHRAPRDSKALIKWLKEPVKPNTFYPEEDDWAFVCREHFFNALEALCALATNEHFLPATRWKTAFQAWRSEKDSLNAHSWRYAAPLVHSIMQEMSAAEFNEIKYSLVYWLESASKEMDTHTEIMWALCQQILDKSESDLPEKNNESRNYYEQAMNSPVGYVTQILLDKWFSRDLNDGDKLPDEIAPFFTRLCDLKKEAFVHGRVLLATQVITLFRVDRPWTEKHLLPLFDWQKHPEEAARVWEAFLHAPRVYQPLMRLLKAPFFETIQRRAQFISSLQNQLINLLTFAALEKIEGYTEEDFSTAIKALPKEDLSTVAKMLVQTLQSNDKKTFCWNNRIKPFWDIYWLKNKDFVLPEITEQLARLCIEADEQFPSALQTLEHWLKPIQYPHGAIESLEKSSLCAKFPDTSLKFLKLITPEKAVFLPDKFKDCLDKIKQAAPQLAQKPEFARLWQIAVKN